ncbi:MAG TPA: hypothetical protein PKJ59_11045, partial [Syntrophales bacterium]|nr:hypothetical protein [Syntrophales bacterium]HQG84454.1 hypothetical protein [Syntrophales bacterium]
MKKGNKINPFRSFYEGHYSSSFFLDGRGSLSNFLSPGGRGSRRGGIDEFRFNDRKEAQEKADRRGKTTVETPEGQT